MPASNLEREGVSPSDGAFTEEYVLESAAVQVSEPPPSALADGVNVVLGEPNNEVAIDIGGVFIAGGSGPEYNNVVGGDGTSTVDTTTPNETKLGTAADYSAIPAGMDNVVGGQACLVSGFHNYSAEGVTHATVAGGSKHKVLADDYGVIGGGTQNEITDGDYATVSGGYLNKISGASSVVAGGEQNEVNERYSAILGGVGNVVDGEYSAIFGGRECSVEGQYASAVGYKAKAEWDGKQAVAYGVFAAVGDAQVSRTVRRIRTTTGSETFVDSFPIPVDTTWLVTAHIVARREDADGESAAYKIEGCIDNNATTVALVGTQTKTVIAEDVAGWDCRIVASNGTDSLQLYVTGETAKDIRWVAVIELVEVTG